MHGLKRAIDGFPRPPFTLLPSARAYIQPDPVAGHPAALWRTLATYQSGNDYGDEGGKRKRKETVPRNREP